jgi:ubiquinone/menaquinone biosynthesis C-methylase UbiE
VDAHTGNGTPDYSPIAGQYARARPGYPAELFAYLSSIVDRHLLAWDCATGNGQAALELVKHFERVIGTDISAEQIGHAVHHPRIAYRVAGANQSGIEKASVDLVAVASAIHWFDLNSFYREVERVVRPGGILAAWSYHVGDVKPPFDKVFNRFYREILAPYFPRGAKLVDDRYETITLPGQPLEVEDFEVRAAMNFDQMTAFIRSWSGTQAFLKERGEDPVDLIAGELRELWGSEQSIHAVRWPLFIKVSRL